MFSKSCIVWLKTTIFRIFSFKSFTGKFTAGTILFVLQAFNRFEQRYQTKDSQALHRLTQSQQTSEYFLFRMSFTGWHKATKWAIICVPSTLQPQVQCHQTNNDLCSKAIRQLVQGHQTNNIAYSLSVSFFDTGTLYLWLDRF